MSVATACANHPKHERVAGCGSCGAALCRECVVHTPVGIKCRACTGERAPARAARSGRRAGGGTRERPRWLVPAAAGAAVAVLALVLVARSGGDGGETDLRFADDDPGTSSSPVDRKIELTGGGGTRIGATVTLPPEGRMAVAGVLIVPGFGAIDRDATMATSTPDGSADRLAQDLNYSRPGTPDNLFVDLSNNLAVRDFATLRYDKRGSGTSPLPADHPMSFDDLVADARAGLDFLAERRESAGRPLAIVGFDQGGLIAMRLAQDPRVKAIVLVSTFGRPLAEVIGDDFVQARGDAGREAAEQLQRVAAGLVAGEPLPAPPSLNGHIRPLLVPGQERYLRQIFAIDPAAEAAAVHVPTLLVRGARDTTVTEADSARLLAALPPGTEEIVVAEGDHNLGVRGTRDPETLPQVTAWLARHVGG